MASNFSGALQLTDLNDFITPSQVDYPFDCLYFVVSNLLRCYACYNLSNEKKFGLYYKNSKFFSMYDELRTRCKL